MAKRVVGETGLTRYIDETGNRYGRLLVLGLLERRRQGQAVWRCRCDCGKETFVYGSALRRGLSKSCGCLKAEESRNRRLLPAGEAAVNALYRSLRGTAIRRGHAWDLTQDEFRGLTSLPCHYCGIAPSQVSLPRHGNGSYTYNGLDRVDNDKGYTPDNVVPCCGKCNIAKGRMSLGQFTKWVVMLYEHISATGLLTGSR